MTAGGEVSRAFPFVVYIDAPLKRSNFGFCAEVAPFLHAVKLKIHIPCFLLNYIYVCTGLYKMNFTE